MDEPTSHNTMIFYYTVLFRLTRLDNILKVVIHSIQCLEQLQMPLMLMMSMMWIDNFNIMYKNALTYVCFDECMCFSLYVCVCVCLRYASSLNVSLMT